MYSETLLDHYESPRNVGEIADADAVGEAENPVCGDRLRLWLRIDGETITDARWKAEGCAPALAAASVASEMLRGMSVTQAGDLSREDISTALGGLPPRKAHAAALVVTTVRQALQSRLT